MIKENKNNEEALLKEIFKNRLKNCKNGKHNLMIISDSSRLDNYNTIRWCRVCGSLVDEHDKLISNPLVLKMLIYSIKKEDKGN